jgi:hypothetical protein
VEGCSYGPTILTMNQLIRGQNVDLQNPDFFRVSDRRVNTAKEVATTPKWRTIVEAFHTWFCRSTF